MTDSATTDPLLALAERVERGESGLDLDREAALALGVLHRDDAGKLYELSADGIRVYSGHGERLFVPRLTTSLDATASLQEAVLPGWRVDSILERLDDVRELRSTNGWTVDLVRPSNSRRAAGFAATLCQAWLAALLRSLAMEAGRG